MNGITRDLFALQLINCDVLVLVVQSFSPLELVTVQSGEVLCVEDQHKDELPVEDFWHFVQKFFEMCNLIVAPAFLALFLDILAVKEARYGGLGWHGYTWFAIVRPLSETTLKTDFNTLKNI